MFDRIPAEMKSYRQWINWRYEINPKDPEGKKLKIPYCPHTGRHASVNDPATWSTFELAVEASKWYDGIGFVFTAGDPFGVIDLDDANGDPTIAQRQQKIYHELDSYSEISPSGNGLHIIVKGYVEAGRKRGYIEVYSSSRYMTMTGNVYRDVPIQARQELFRAVWDAIGGGVSMSFYDGMIEQKEVDETIIERALNAQNGDKFAALHRGEWQGFYNSQSEADFAYVDILAFYTQNRIQLRRMFQSSPLGARNKKTTIRGVEYLDHMINRSFDRMLPPVDIDGLGEQMRLELIERAATQAIPQTVVQSTPIFAPVVPTETQPFLPGLPIAVKPLHLSDMPPGLVGEIAQFVYQSAPRPLPEAALAAALALVAGIAGRGWNIEGNGLNQYFLLLAATGNGKEAMATGISRIMARVQETVQTAREFVGPSMIASGQALIKHLDRTSKCFVSVIGEFGLMLQTLTAYNANSSHVQLKRILLDLYHKSGVGQSVAASVYADSDKNVGSIISPAFTLLCESVPDNFYKTLNEDMVAEGFLPRFTIIEYQGRRPRYNKHHASVQVPFRLIENVGALVVQASTLQHGGKTIFVRMNEDAEKFLDDLNAFADFQMDNATTDTIKQLWNRAHVKAMRLAAVVAVGCNMFEPVVTLENVKWAQSLVVHDIMRLLKKFERGEIGQDNIETEQYDTVRKVCVEYLRSDYDSLAAYSVARNLFDAKIIPLAYVQRRLTSNACFRKDMRGATYAIYRAMKALMDGDILQEIGPRQMEQYKTRQKAYMVSDYRRLSSEI